MPSRATLVSVLPTVASPAFLRELTVPMCSGSAVHRASFHVADLRYFDSPSTATLCGLRYSKSSLIDEGIERQAGYTGV